MSELGAKTNQTLKSLQTDSTTYQECNCNPWRSVREGMSVEKKIKKGAVPSAAKVKLWMWRILKREERGMQRDGAPGSLQINTQSTWQREDS